MPTQPQHGPTSLPTGSQLYPRLLPDFPQHQGQSNPPLPPSTSAALVASQYMLGFVALWSGKGAGSGYQVARICRSRPCSVRVTRMSTTDGDLSAFREEYSKDGLDIRSMAPAPMDQFNAWFQDAKSANCHEPNAMCLASADADGKPSARMVLCKGYDERGIVFYTNYGSQKSRELDQNPRAAAVFWWDALERSVRFEGDVERVSQEESDSYFASRPRGSQIAAAASNQSQPIGSRDALEKQWIELEKQGDEMQRPAGWGGYRIKPNRVEFWKGRESRMHDRIVYTPEDSGTWSQTRLQP